MAKQSNNLCDQQKTQISKSDQSSLSSRSKTVLQKRIDAGSAGLGNGVSPITQLRTCVIKIVNIALKGKNSLPLGANSFP